MSRSTTIHILAPRLRFLAAGIFTIIMLYCVAGAAGGFEARMTVLWIDNGTTCGGESMFSNVVAEVDELQAQFVQTPEVIGTDPSWQSDAAMKTLLKNKSADLAIWMSCEDGTIHLFTPLLQTPLQTKSVGQNKNGQLPVEAVTAIVRNWLEGVLPVWRQKNAPVPSPNEPPSEDKSSAPSDDRDVPLPATVSTDRIEFVEASPRTPSLFRISVGLDATTSGGGRFIPGGYAEATIRPWPGIGFGISGTIMKSTAYSVYDVSVELRQYPLRATVICVFPVSDVEFSGHLAFELVPVRRTVEIADGGAPASSWKFQPAVVGQVGAAFSMTRRMSWFLYLGARILLRATILQIRVGTRMETVHNPWKLQPMLLTGLRLTLF